MDTQNTNPDLSHVSLTPNNGPNYELLAQLSVLQRNYELSAQYTTLQPYNPSAQYTTLQPYGSSGAPYGTSVGFNPSVNAAPTAPNVLNYYFYSLDQRSASQSYGSSDQHGASQPYCSSGAPYGTPVGFNPSVSAPKDSQYPSPTAPNVPTYQFPTQYSASQSYGSSDQHDASLPDDIFGACGEDQEFLSYEELVDGCHVSTDFNVFDRSSTVPHDQEPMPLLPKELNKDQVVTCLKTLLMPIFLAYRKPKTEELSMNVLIGKYDDFMNMLNKDWELLRNREALALFYNKARQAIIEDAKHMITKANSINNACINETKPEFSMIDLAYRNAIKAAYGSKDCSSSERELLTELYECFGLAHKNRKWNMVRNAKNAKNAKNSKNPNNLQKYLYGITKEKQCAEDIPEFADSVSEKQVGWMNLDNKILELIEYIDKKIYADIVNDKYMVDPNHIMKIRKMIIAIFKQYPSYEQYMPNIKLSVTEEYVSPPYTNIGQGYLVKALSLRHGRARHVLTLSVKFDDAPPISENLTYLKRDLWQGIHDILSEPLRSRLANHMVRRFRCQKREENLGESSTAEPLLPESSPDSQSSPDILTTLGSQSTKRKSTTTLTLTAETDPKRAKNLSPMQGVTVGQPCS